jgi:hypothetical protein
MGGRHRSYHEDIDANEDRFLDSKFQIPGIEELTNLAKTLAIIPQEKSKLKLSGNGTYVILSGTSIDILSTVPLALTFVPLGSTPSIPFLFNYPNHTTPPTVPSPPPKRKSGKHTSPP